MNKNITVIANICLSNIPKEMMKKGKNGKIYASFVLRSLKEPDEYDQNMYIAMAQTKEEMEQKTDLTFVGRARSYEFTDGHEKIEDMAPLTPGDKLPF